MSTVVSGMHDFLLLLLAGFLSGLLGFERELKDKPAGLRTHILVGVAACLLMIAGDSVVDKFEQSNGAGLQSDPIRIIQAIVIGISFLGAGTIIQNREDVEGLTTAASILLTAGVGISVATEDYGLAVATVILAVIVLQGFGWIENRLKERSAKYGAAETAGRHARSTASASPTPYTSTSPRDPN